MKSFKTKFFSIQAIPSILSWMVFIAFFFAFLSLNTDYISLGKRATASIAPIEAISYPQVREPSFMPYQSFFPARILYEPSYHSVAPLGPNFMDLYETTPDFHIDFAWTKLIDRLELDGFDRKFLVYTFASLGPESYSPQYMAAKIYELYRVGDGRIETPHRAEDLVPRYYQQLVEKVNLAEILKFSKKYKREFQDIRKRYGVPEEIVLSILAVETSFGTNLGNNSALQVLGSMAATDNVAMLAYNGPTRQTKALSSYALNRTLQARSEWAYKELTALLDFSRRYKRNIAAMPSSRFGAIGLCQFMPSNIEAFGIDGDRDGRIDLFTPVDAMHSVANYLSKHGWSSNAGKSHQLQIIYTYNHDYTYAQNVLTVANQIKGGKDGSIALSRNPLRAISWQASHSDSFLAKRIRTGGRTAPIKGKLDNYSSLLGL